MSVQAFSTLCETLGLPAAPARDVEQLFAKDKEDLLPLLDWLCSGHLTSENRLSDHERSSFRQIQAEGATLNGDQLKVELEQAHRRDARGTEELKQEVEQLGAAVTKATTHVHRMRAQRDSLAAAVAEQTQHQRPLRGELQRACNVHSGYAPATTKASLRLDQSAEDLAGKLREQFALFHSDASATSSGNTTSASTSTSTSTTTTATSSSNGHAAGTSSSSSSSLPDTATAMFMYQDTAGLMERLRSEESFTHRLAQYVKKQFKDSFVALAAANDDTPAYSLVDIVASTSSSSQHRDQQQQQQHMFIQQSNTNPHSGLNSAHAQHQAHRQELLRLRSVDAMTTENLARARVRRAQKAAGLQALQALLFKCEENRMEAMAVLSRLSAAEQAEAQRLETELRTIWEQFREAATKCAELQGTSTLLGNCALKLARQRYVHAKQDLLITHLRQQRARWQFVEICTNLEEQTIRRQRHLLESTLKFVRDARSGVADRIHAMAAVRTAGEGERAVVSQADTGTMALFHLLQRPDGDQRPQLVTYERVAQLLQQCNEHRRAARHHLHQQQQQYHKQLSELALCKDVLESLAYDANGTALALTLPTITSRIAQLEAALNDDATAVAELKDGITAHQDRLQSDPTTRDAQRLFLAFCTQPDSLTAALAHARGSA